ncbi:MAG: hypothetical protein A3G59_00475 [Candidatus Taylorbacteria bacterium RIFCSPLOWO2_12_FULL_47_20]|uniref:Ribulose-phosphate 3-epimerase n=2 Tax=Candidatus Tayloriibacteriota TaxID=1817919 RepID=A0A1G2P9N5_9BACT|nr:MAG: hypothetical protein A3H68_03450 [Candidatus Taylorbacteria bacterium RIFCSPLOWO2_02_FULL_46_40]OHA45046.1 MAG: hypothetical protein A3G59_00475 [Candidatus Taylorbacteria bacterium RIFCSPLOWO2_12_FULL_47_20]
MAEIIPAILPKNWEELSLKLTTLARLREEDNAIAEDVRVVQVDICDGVLTKHATWPYDNKDSGAHFQKIVNQQEGIPDWDVLDFEFDLMVEKPIEVVDEFISAGALRLVFHDRALVGEDEFEKILEKVAGSCEVGVALNIGKGENFTKYKGKTDFVQCMGIRRLGFQGEEFSEEVLQTVEAIKKIDSEAVVSVDGGVTLENARSLISAGASRLVVGSAIWQSDDIIETIRSLNRL